MDTQKIGELLSPERFKQWIEVQEVGKVGITADSWNCPLAYYLADNLGVGVCNVEVGEDCISLKDGTDYNLDVYSWPHHFVLAIDELDPFTNKLPVAHADALLCLEKAVKEALFWAYDTNLVECETCGKRIDSTTASHTMEPDTGAYSYFCVECDGFLYEPDY